MPVQVRHAGRRGVYCLVFGASGFLFLSYYSAPVTWRTYGLLVALVVSGCLLVKEFLEAREWRN